jgi:hypothetical protein
MKWRLGTRVSVPLPCTALHCTVVIGSKVIDSVVMDCVVIDSTVTLPGCGAANMAQHGSDTQSVSAGDRAGSVRAFTGAGGTESFGI